MSTPHPLERIGLHCHDARALVVGLGKTGYSIARFLAAQGVAFAIADSRESPPLLAELRETLPDAAVFLGGFQSAAFTAATHVIVSPGVPLDIPAIADADRRGLPVLGDLDLFALMVKAPVLAITGSNGKSTVTTLAGMMAEAAGRKTRVGGNLGTPMLDLLDASAELYVLELSSFQLERSHFLEPVAATLLNISPDHMDRYPDLESYAATKRRIFQGWGRMVLNRDDPVVAGMAEAGRDVVWFGVEEQPAEYALGRIDGDVEYQPAEYALGRIDGEEWLLARGEPLLKASEVRIRGRHNLANALAAVALCDAVDIPRQPMIEVLRRFGGLDHRMQRVAEIGGVVWVNDSKATNVGACQAALAGLEGKAVLLAGGDGKGADFSVLRPVVAEKVRALVLMGRDAPLLEQVLHDLVPVTRVENMAQAVQAARGLAQPGDTVLLTPACASLDQYKDYQERGRMFAEAVAMLRE